MEAKRVWSLVVPLAEGTLRTPVVSPEALLVDAIRLMTDNGLSRIAVARRGRRIGQLELTDALRALGLEETAWQEQ